MDAAASERAVAAPASHYAYDMRCAPPDCHVDAAARARAVTPRAAVLPQRCPPAVLRLRCSGHIIGHASCFSTASSFVCFIVIVV